MTSNVDYITLTEEIMRNEIKLSVLLALVGCGQKVDLSSYDPSQIHIWHEEMKCHEIIYPTYVRECNSQHLSCNTYANGKAECLIHIQGRELEERL